MGHNTPKVPQKPFVSSLRLTVRADLTNQGDSIFGFDLFMLVSGGGLAGPVTQPLQTAFQCGACFEPSPGPRQCLLESRGGPEVNSSLL